MTSPLSDPAAGAQDLWCRLERDGERIVGVGLMHPDGRILFSYAADHFDAGRGGGWRVARSGPT
jgi:hypothetical protein